MFMLKSCESDKVETQPTRAERIVDSVPERLG